MWWIRSLITNGYDFTGRLLKTKQTHTVAWSDSTRDPDHCKRHTNMIISGRLLTTNQNINNQSLTIISQNTYNELSQPIQKDSEGLSNSPFLQSIHYGYNIRGWLQNINHLDDLGNTNELFAEEIGYQENTSSNSQEGPLSPMVTNGLNTTPQYNGNISYVLWGTLHGVDSPSWRIKIFVFLPLWSLKQNYKCTFCRIYSK